MPNLAEFEDFVKKQGGNAGLAKTMGVSISTVSAWRTGRNGIDPVHKAKMTTELMYEGRYPDEVPDIATQADIKALEEEIRREMKAEVAALRGEIRQMAEWVRREENKEHKALGAALAECLAKLGGDPGTPLGELIAPDPK